MFERFTDRARRAVVLASDDARELGHGYIGPEHILLGLAHEGHGVGAMVLTSLAITEEGIRRQIEEAAGRGEHAPAGHIPFTSCAKSALERAVRESLLLGHDYIATEHLLLGIAGDSGGLAAGILASSGADFARIHALVLRQLDSLGAGGAESASPGTPAEPESTDESSLFSYALTLAMGAPEIVRAAAGMQADAIQEHMLQRRNQIWPAVAQQRAQLRTAAADLKAVEGDVMPPAEAAARMDHPELLAICGEAAVHEEQIRERMAQCAALVTEFGKASGHKLTSDQTRRADLVTAAAEDTLQQGDAWLTGVRLERQQAGSSGSVAARQPAGQDRAFRGLQARLHQMTARSVRNASAGYLQGSSLLTRLRKQAAAISMESKRAELQLSQFARQIAMQDDAFAASAAKLEAASNALAAALRHALIPEILSLVYQPR
jgi:hypothetical protein